MVSEAIVVEDGKLRVALKVGTLVRSVHKLLCGALEWLCGALE